MFESPLANRYASQEMSSLFTPYTKAVTWRMLWIALAKAQKELGLAITEEQIHQMEQAVAEVNFDAIASYEKKFRHDVMAHIHAFGDLCPKARGIIHLGATSCYVTDNGDLIQMKQALCLIQGKLVHLLRLLTKRAKEHAHLTCLSYTHLQTAQPTTLGKRICLWLQDFLLDLQELQHRLEHLYFLGVKGATGTQASFLTLFDGDSSKVKALEEKVALQLGFSKVFSIAGQTYSRKQDIAILGVLSSFAASAHKFATDLRLLSHMKEVLEPFGPDQVGSSAMPYKRNPVLSERVCGIARYLMSLQENPLYTAATQWLERSLDDSSNRRLVLPDAFLAADAILNLLLTLAGFVVQDKVIERRVKQELPLLATESILMAAVKKGKDRQIVHEILRKHTQQSPSEDLLTLLALEDLSLTSQELHSLMDPSLFIGRAQEQVQEFLSLEVEPLLSTYAHIPSYEVVIEF